MDNPEKLTTSGTQFTWWRQTKDKSTMDNPEKLTTLGTQYTGWRQTFVCLHHVNCVPDVLSFSGLSIVFLSFVCLHPVYCVPNVVSFSGLSIVFLHWEHNSHDEDKQNTKIQWTIQRNLQHWEHNTQDEDKQNTKIQWTIQRNLKHREHNSHDEDKQNTKIQCFSGLSIVFLCFVCLHPVYCVPNVVSFSGLSIVFLCFVCPNKTQKYNGQSRETYNIGNTIHMMKTNKTQKYNGQSSSQCCKFLWIVHCIFVFCLSSSCVLCSQCFKFLWIVHCIFVFCLSSSCELCSQCFKFLSQKYNGQSRETYNIGNTIHMMKTNKRQKYNGQSRET
jgi:hypothetical protein